MAVQAAIGFYDKDLLPGGNIVIPFPVCEDTRNVKIRQIHEDLTYIQGFQFFAVAPQLLKEHLLHLSAVLFLVAHHADQQISILIHIKAGDILVFSQFYRHLLCLLAVHIHRDYL